MTTLGDLLAAARRSSGGFQNWIEAADPKFADEVKSALQYTGDPSIGSFARAAVADFSRFADEEDWSQLTRIIRDHEDPGAACLVAMVRWRLSAAACPDHAPLQPGED
ncbi:MAG TPA: hypothetical protein VK035_01460 [Kiloniellales bacterium]|nr:hypothetical protein [Kiloniellales bacterium]